MKGTNPHAIIQPSHHEPATWPVFQDLHDELQSRYCYTSHGSRNVLEWHHTPRVKERALACAYGQPDVAGQERGAKDIRHQSLDQCVGLDSLRSPIVIDTFPRCLSLRRRQKTRLFFHIRTFG
jgi:hypothetical protein